MNIADIRSAAFAMPLTSPAFPRGPYRFARREHLIISYETDPDALRAVVPEPQQITGSLVKYEFIRMPDSTGFGDYTESGQVIPVSLDGVEGSYVHAMYLNDHPPIAGGRELWGFPKKLAQPTLAVDVDTLVGTLDPSSRRSAPSSRLISSSRWIRVVPSRRSARRRPGAGPTSTPGECRCRRRRRGRTGWIGIMVPIPIVCHVRGRFQNGVHGRAHEMS